MKEMRIWMAAAAVLLSPLAIESARAETPGVYYYQGNLQGTPQRTWALQRALGDTPGPPISMTLTINGDTVSGTISYDGFVEKLSGYKRDGQCVLSTTSSASVIGFCANQFKGKLKVYNRQVRFQDQERDFAVTLAKVQRLAPADPEAWLGRSPLEIIDGANLFNIETVEFEKGFAYVNGPDPRRRASREVTWGHVTKTVQAAKDGGNTLYLFPFCFAGDCADPNTAATGLGVLVQGRYNNAPSAELYLAAIQPFGTRSCLTPSGKWTIPTCYNETVRHAFNRANLSVAARDLVPRYHAVGNAYEASHPAEKGSMKDIADHSQCDYVTVESRDGYGGKHYSSKLVCEYVP